MKSKNTAHSQLPIPDSKSILVVPLGGTERVGMNATLVGHAGRWIMIDAGATFAGADDDGAAAFGEHYGGKVQQIVPDFRNLKDVLPRLDGIVITHSHEDHIGALSPMHAFKQAWPGLENVPLYAGDYARGVIRRKLEEIGAKPTVGRISARKLTKIGPFEIYPIHVTHSAPETFMLAIKTPAGTIVFGSDTKLDTGPLIGRTTDTQMLEALGNHGVLAAFLDSTGAIHSGRSTSEAEVSLNLAKIMRHHNGRVVVSTFASNLARIAGVSKAAEQAGRKLGAAGRTIFNNLETALDIKMFDADRIQFAENYALNGMKASKTAYVCTGTQAEQGSALRRAAEDLERGYRNKRGLVLEKGDLVIHSARIIPGNEETVRAMFAGLRKEGVIVMTADDAKTPIHASGHGKHDEIEDMYRMIKPRFAVPVHGHGQLTDAHAEIARSMNGVKDVRTPLEGEVMRIDNESMRIVGRMNVGTLAIVSQGDRNSGENRLVAWKDAEEIDMMHRNQGQEHARRTQRPVKQERQHAPAMGR